MTAIPSVAALPTVLLSECRLLPNAAGIYFVLDADNQILYIGKASSLVGRWNSHHRKHQFKAMSNIRLAWLEVSDVSLLDTIEVALIEHFSPSLNWADVPKQPPRPPRQPLAVHHIEAELITELEQAMKRAGKTQADFAAAKGSSRQAVNPYFTGRKALLTDTALELFEFLGVRVKLVVPQESVE